MESDVRPRAEAEASASQFDLGSGIARRATDLDGGMKKTTKRVLTRRRTPKATRDDFRTAAAAGLISRQAALDAVPTNWVDSLLTGPDAVIGKYPFGCPDIQNLLLAIRRRIAEIE
jgi:hypothetical protein